MQLNSLLNLQERWENDPPSFSLSPYLKGYCGIKFHPIWLHNGLPVTSLNIYFNLSLSDYCPHFYCRWYSKKMLGFEFVFFLLSNLGPQATQDQTAEKPTCWSPYSASQIHVCFIITGLKWFPFNQSSAETTEKYGWICPLYLQVLRFNQNINISKIFKKKKKLENSKKQNEFMHWQLFISISMVFIITYKKSGMLQSMGS